MSNQNILLSLLVHVSGARLCPSSNMQGRRQVKICGVDIHGERGGLEAEPTGQTPLPLPL